MSDRAESRGRRGRLIDGCITCVDQCGDLLRNMPDEVFASREGGSSSIGAHVRHILDRFHCFFNGIDEGCINFDDRKRGTSVETDVRIAADVLTATRDRFKNLDLDAFNAGISVRELVHFNGEPTIAASTLDRELMGLITHSIHHLAIIAIIARSSSFPVSANLGKAPSTIAAE